MGLLSRIGIGQAQHFDFDHGASDLEATLPAQVDGRPLIKWSICGLEFWRAVGRKPGANDEAKLQALGLSRDDMAMAVAGRADARRAPPYIVWAVRFGGLTGYALREPLPSYLAMAVMRVDPNRGDGFKDATLGGRSVMVGNRAMVNQNNHHRGLPYVYLTDSAIYAVITEEERWAAEAIRALPPVRDSD